MAMKEYSAFPEAPALLEPHHHPGHSLGRVFTLCKDDVGVLYSLSQMGWDELGTYSGHSLGESYPSAEMQSVYFTTEAKCSNWFIISCDVCTDIYFRLCVDFWVYFLPKQENIFYEFVDDIKIWQKFKSHSQLNSTEPRYPRFHLSTVDSISTTFIKTNLAYIYIYIYIYIYTQPLLTSRMRHKVNFYVEFNRFEEFSFS